MKQLLLSLVLLLLGPTGYAQSSTDDFTGKWKAENGKIVIMKRQNNVYSGYNEEGKLLMYDIAFIEGKWKGRGREPHTGITGKCEITRKGDTLIVVGGVGFITKTYTWTKIN